MANVTWIGQTLNGRYQIEELLGQGGMSAVYKATDPNLRRVVAIKMIHPHLSGKLDFVRRFEEEAAAVAQLRHPNIVQVYDFNHDGDVYYIVLEFLPGETLQDRLNRLNASKRSMPLSEAVKYLGDVTEAIRYAHERGTIHRDIKPANIMLDVYGRAILMDFGIAKILGGQQHTATGAVVGTALYMSPEQIQGERPDERADIYSLGVTLFETISGRPPFDADSAMTLMMMHINDPVPDIRELQPAVPPELAALVERALAKKKSLRYQNASELAAALHRVQSALETAERPAVDGSHTQVDLPAQALPGPASQPAAQATQIEPPAPAGTLIEPPVKHSAAQDPPPIRTEVDLPAATPVAYEPPTAPRTQVETPQWPPVAEVLVSSESDQKTVFDPRPATDTPVFPEPQPWSDPQVASAAAGAAAAQSRSVDGPEGVPHSPAAAGPTVAAALGGSGGGLSGYPSPSGSAGKGISRPLLIGGALAGVAALVMISVLLFSQLMRGDDGSGGTLAALNQPAATTAAPALVVALPSDTPAPSPTPQPSATPEPTLTPTITSSPTQTQPAGPYARINAITNDNGVYVVEYETFGYTEQLPGQHVHFFFDTVQPEQAGVPGSGPWILYGGPRPFRGYTVASRPAAAYQMCALAANANHSVIADSGNCVDLPE